MKEFKLRILILVCFILGVRGEIGGIISMSDSVIQEEDVTYSFDLTLQQTIPSDGKIFVRFPSEFTFSATDTLTCNGVSGFTSNAFTCDFNYQARIMTITDAFPTLLNSI
mmetsp:Transcript_22946/g.22277  ORF Transcript_22946/g.22277 Transcript_22946/m.22277 type:complete len:110 (+) Transcript_22946:3-332(+)